LKGELFLQHFPGTGFMFLGIGSKQDGNPVRLKVSEVPDILF